MIDPPPLDYIAPRDDAGEAARRRGNFRLGLVTSTLLGTGTPTVAICCGVSYMHSSDPMGEILPLLILGAGVVLWAGFAVVGRRRPGFLPGMLTGVGVALLIFGACFGLTLT